MLPKQNRLKHEKDFKVVFDDGRGCSGDFFVIKTLNRAKNSEFDAGESRFGFVVGKKVSKFAVSRNRIKRKMREVVRLMLKNGLIKQGFDVVVVAKPSVQRESFDQIADDLKKTLKKSNVF